MSIIDNENEIMNNFFFNCAEESFLLSSINDMNDNTNDPINESKEEPQAKQQIKFILTKQNPLPQAGRGDTKFLNYIRFIR